MDVINLFYSTVAYRPYVFGLLLFYLLLATRSLGWARTAVFTFLTWSLAFTAEYSSTHIGVPFGPYVYLEATRERELWIANVPFMDSLSFIFLAYASYALALAFCLPVQQAGKFVRIVDVKRIRQSWGVWLLAVLFFVLIDVVIDPVAVMGDRWFLGKIFYYPEGGIYFGVPLSNFIGWAVVGALSIGLFQWLDRRYWSDCPTRPLLSAAGLYYLVLGFNLAVTFWIGERLLGLVGLFIHLPIVLLLLIRLGHTTWIATVDDETAGGGTRTS